MHNFLKKRGLNSVIVTSTNKGFHFYLQIPTMCFGEDEFDKYDRRERNRLFVKFTKNLVNPQGFQYNYLDPTNTNAGLKGNIRLLGSIHPKTNETVEIVKGEFLDLCDDDVMMDYYDVCFDYVNTIYQSSIHNFRITERFRKKELENKKKKYKDKHWEDPIRENDLREVLPQLYGGKVNKYNGYIFMQCPWHTDRRPSLMVTKEWFYCTGCGTKGNIWTLIKNGTFKNYGKSSES